MFAQVHTHMHVGVRGQHQMLSSITPFYLNIWRPDPSLSLEHIDSGRLAGWPVTSRYLTCLFPSQAGVTDAQCHIRLCPWVYMGSELSSSYLWEPSSQPSPTLFFVHFILPAWTYVHHVSVSCLWLGTEYNNIF